MNRKETCRTVICAFLLSILVWGCGDREGPYPIDTSGGTLEVYAVSETLRITRSSSGDRITLRRPKVNGAYSGFEWDVIPTTYIRMDGLSGNGGSTFYLAAKAAYTSKHIYFFFQWADPTENKIWRPLVYNGPPWQEAYNCTTKVDSLTPQKYWGRSKDDEDRLALLFEIEPTAGAYGDFASHGCASFCHGVQSPWRTTSGKLDLWEWEASRSNAEYVDIYSGENKTQTGFCEDKYVDSEGLKPDTLGWTVDRRDSLYALNFHPDSGYSPLRIAGRVNEGFSKARYIWWATSKRFSPCETTNPAAENEYWKTGDITPSLIVRKKFAGDSDPQNPIFNQSPFDIMAKGVWTDPGRWTLEIVRLLDTGRAGEDVRFDTDRQYNFTIAIMDNSGEIHSGSMPLILSFRHRE